MFIPLTWFFGVETSGRTLEQIDRLFYEEPRVLMGLNPNATKVVKYSKADEESRFAALADLSDRKMSVADMDRRMSAGSIDKGATTSIEK